MRATGCRLPLSANLASKWLQLTSLGQRDREGPLLLIDNLKGSLWKYVFQKIFSRYYNTYFFSKISNLYILRLNWVFSMKGLDIWLLKTNKEAILSEITIDERNLFLFDMFVLFYEILLKIFSWIMNTKTSIEPKNWIYIWTMNNKLKYDSLKNYLGLEPTYFMSHKLEDVRWNYFEALWNLGVWIKIFARYKGNVGNKVWKLSVIMLMNICSILDWHNVSMSWLRGRIN